MNRRQGKFNCRSEKVRRMNKKELENGLCKNPTKAD